MIEQAVERFTVETRGPGFYDLTDDLCSWSRKAGAHDGLLTLHVRHTSCSLVIQENADPTVKLDLAEALEDLAPRGKCYRHATEGPDDMPAHIKAMVTATSLSIPVIGGAVQLGTWQGVYLVEHRDAPHRREVAAHLLFERAI